MGLLTRMRKQDAVWWQATGHDRFGAPTYADPEAIKVRWEDTDAEHRTPEGTTGECNNTVFVGVDMAIGDLLWLGLLDDFPTEFADNPTGGGAIEITRFEKIPKLNAREFLRIAYC